MELNNDKNFDIAKPSRRIIAFLFDLLLNLAVAMILLIPAILAVVNVFVKNNAENIVALFFASLISGALAICFSIFYFVCLPVFWDGQTVGKRFFGIRIIDTTTNETPNAKVMFIREALRILLCIITFGLSLLASFFSLLLSDKHVTFSEEISSTRVVEAIPSKEDIKEDK